jgi:hypothetical protein
MTGALEYVFAVFGIWLIWQVAEIFITAPRWAWLAAAAVLGVLAKLSINDEHWWIGIGIGGGAAFLAKLSDLILVATDQARTSVLRRSR